MLYLTERISCFVAVKLDIQARFRTPVESVKLIMILDNGSYTTPASSSPAPVVSVYRPGLPGVKGDLEHLKLQVSIHYEYSQDNLYRVVMLIRHQEAEA